jgi:hypothetical protein
MAPEKRSAERSARIALEISTYLRERNPEKYREGHEEALKRILSGLGLLMTHIAWIEFAFSTRCGLDQSWILPIGLRAEFDLDHCPGGQTLTDPNDRLPRVPRRGRTECGRCHNRARATNALHG